MSLIYILGLCFDINYKFGICLACIMYLQAYNLNLNVLQTYNLVIRYLFCENKHFFSTILSNPNIFCLQIMLTWRSKSQV